MGYEVFIVKDQMTISLFKECALSSKSLIAQICECLQPNDRYSYENGLSLVW